MVRRAREGDTLVYSTGTVPVRASADVAKTATSGVVKIWLEKKGRNGTPVSIIRGLSDDREALEFGRRQRLIVRETIDLVSGAASYGDITAEAGFTLLQDMDKAGRVLRLPKSAQELAR